MRALQTCYTCTCAHKYQHACRSFSPQSLTHVIHIQDSCGSISPCQNTSLPKLHSQIPRFLQPSFPDQPRVSLSCFWMTDGYLWEATGVMWVFGYLQHLLALELMFSSSFSLFMVHFLENTSVGLLGRLDLYSLPCWKPEAQLHRCTSLMGSCLFSQA